VNEKVYKREQFIVGAAKMVQSRVLQDLSVNDHQRFPKCEVQIEESLISSPLITGMQSIAFSCFVLAFFFIIICFNVTFLLVSKQSHVFFLTFCFKRF